MKIFTLKVSLATEPSFLSIVLEMLEMQFFSFLINDYCFIGYAVDPSEENATGER